MHNTGAGDGASGTSSMRGNICNRSLISILISNRDVM